MAFSKDESTAVHATYVVPHEADAVSSPVLVIPAYKPSRDLPDIMRQILQSQLIQAAIVIDDGSGSEYEDTFAELEDVPEVLLVRHMVNLGKGAALRTGLNLAGTQFASAVGVVTADADGQHRVPDILAVATALVANPRSLILGARHMEGNVPLRSRFGNAVTKSVMRVVTGQNLRDTQTGLRGISMDLIPSLLRLKTTGYDFELDMLVTCKYTARSIKEVRISTVYLDENRSSHFNPLVDSMRIYFVLLRFTFISISTALLDNVVFLATIRMWPDVLTSQIAGRLCAGMFNYYANKTGTFHSSTRHAIALPKYWVTVVVFGVLSYILIEIFLAYKVLDVVAAKLLAESILFLLSFIVQRDFVFTKRNSCE